MRCLQCGASIAPGEEKCPRGHPAGRRDTREHVANPAAETGAEKESSFLFSGSDLFSEGFAAATAALSSPLFECERCARLVETQLHQGRRIIPNFCPWCGKPVTPIVGREIDGYRVDQLIAEGGFGLIYLASNIAEPKMKSVVKFLRPQMGYLRPELVRIFVEEARLTEEVGRTCWNVVRVSNVREKPFPYFFMEYIRGMTLDKLLREKKGKEQLAIDDCKGYLRGIAKALAATHAHGRVHRDLKPLNIMVIQEGEIEEPENRIKLLDFGLSMRIASKTSVVPDAVSGLGLTDAEKDPNSALQSAGTPEYMPPEAFDGRNEFVGDVYSFGVTAYEIITGESPWTPPAGDAPRLFYWRDAHKQTPPRPIRDVRPDVPGWLAKGIMRCLEKDPAKRTRSADELTAQLNDPLPRWVWASAAAVLCLFVALAGLAIRAGGVERSAEWTVDGTTRENPLHVWVRDAKDLPGVEISARAGEGRELLSYTRCPQGARCEVVDGAVLVRFEEGPDLADLVDVPLELEAEGADFGLAGKIQVGLDTTPPSIEDLQMLDRSRSPPVLMPLPEVRRFHPSVTLAAKVVEEHIHRVRLILPDRHDNPRQTSIEGEAVDAVVWSFPLKSLSEGEYRGWVEAVDLARNKSIGPEIEFTIDRRVGLVLVSQARQKLFARGKAFYEIRMEEPLARLEVGEGASAKEGEIYDISSSNALEIARLAKLTPLELRSLEARQTYLLGVKVDPAVGGKFTLHAADTATPPNKDSWSLPIELTPDLEPIDVPRVVLEFDGGETEAVQPEFQLSRPARWSRIETLRLYLKRDRVHGLDLLVNGKPLSRKASVDDRWAVIEGIDLLSDAAKAETRNDLTLVLLDPLERKLQIDLAVEVDLKPPKVQVHSTSEGKGGRRDHRVKEWKEVKMWIDADEVLSGATCRIQGSDIPGIADGKRVSFDDLSGLRYAEGPHAYEIEARDLAGNSCLRSGVLQINQDQPRIAVREVSPGAVVLTTDDLSFEVVDLNDFDYSKSSVRFEPSGAKPFQLPVTEPVDSTSRVHSVNVARLADGTSGKLIIRMTDKFDWERKKELTFTVRRPRARWKPRFTWGEAGLEWVLVAPGEGKEFYITRTEVPNRAYLQFYRSGKVKRPKFWGEDGSFPTYSRDGKSQPGGEFPLVGITPQDAAAFAKEVFGARLPTYQEWLQAAWRTHTGPYPWKDAEAGREYANCYLSWKREGSAFFEHHYDKAMYGGAKRTFVCLAVEANFDPSRALEPGIKARLNYSGDILHMIGNAGELVLFEGSYWIAGGDFGLKYEQIDLRETPEGPFTDPNARTGFRLIIPLKEASREFKEAATEGGRK